MLVQSVRLHHDNMIRLKLLRSMPCFNLTQMGTSCSIIMYVFTCQLYKASFWQKPYGPTKAPYPVGAYITDILSNKEEKKPENCCQSKITLFLWRLVWWPSMILSRVLVWTFFLQFVIYHSWMQISVILKIWYFVLPLYLHYFMCVCASSLYLCTHALL